MFRSIEILFLKTIPGLKNLQALKNNRRLAIRFPKVATSF